MQTRACLIAAAMASSIGLGQQKPDGHVKVLTVCEMLGWVNQYLDSSVAIVGRMDRSVSLVDHYEFLSQDRCEHPIITHGHTFPSKIQVWAGWEEGMPKPPSDRPRLDHAALARKLSAVRKTTALGSHEEPRLKPDGHPKIAMVPNEWAVVYGRIVKSPRLDEDCGAGGCGGDDVPLNIIADPREVHRLTDDGSLFPNDQAGSHP